MELDQSTYDWFTFLFWHIFVIVYILKNGDISQSFFLLLYKVKEYPNLIPKKSLKNKLEKEKKVVIWSGRINKIVLRMINLFGD